MEKLVSELKELVQFKDSTVEGDIVLIAAKQPQMLSYAVVGEIQRDQGRKDEWWHVTLHLLGIPVQTLVWTLRAPQFTGQEIFTMGGEGRFIKAIALPISPRQDSSEPPAKSSKKPTLRLVK